MFSFIKKLRKRETLIEQLRHNGAKIGNNVDIINSHIDYGHSFLIEIGNDVTITNATVLAHDASTKKFIGKTKVGKVIIGDRVFIGFGSIVLPNVRIGNDVIIGAGTIVTKSIPDNSLVVGNPGKIIGKVSDYIEKNKNNIKICPVYNNYWINKTLEEKNKMIKELENSIGYDE